MKESILKQPSITNIKNIAAQQQESEQSKFNFSFQDANKHLNVKQDTSVTIPLPLIRDLNRVESLSEFSPLKIDKKSTSQLVREQL